MHSIGIIAAKKQGKLVALTGMMLTTGGSSMSTNIRFLPDGTMTKGTHTTPGPLIPGEWYVPGETTNIGASYRIRWVLEAGTFVPSRGGALVGASGEWDVIGTIQSNISASAGTGRFRIEIQDIATSTLQASAQFWTSGFAP